MLPTCSILGLIDPNLGMFRSKPHSDVESLTGNICGKNLLINVMSRVSRGKNVVVRFKNAPILRNNFFETIGRPLKVFGPRFEMHGTTIVIEVACEIVDDATDLVAADVGVGEIQNFLGSAKAHHLLHDKGFEGRLDAGDELAIRKSTRAALAKTHVGVCLDLSMAPVLGDVFHARKNRLSALQDLARKTALQKPEPCKKPRGSGSNDRCRRQVFAGTHPRRSSKHQSGGLGSRKSLDRVDMVELVFATRVQGLLKDTERSHRRIEPSKLGFEALTDHDFDVFENGHPMRG